MVPSIFPPALGRGKGEAPADGIFYLPAGRVAVAEARNEILHGVQFSLQAEVRVENERSESFRPQDDE